MKMKSLFTIVVAIFLATPLLAQDQLQKLCDNKGYVAIMYYSGDAINITCDTVYLINTSAYKLYDQVFRNHKALNADTKRLATLYDYTKTLYENRIREQNEEYNALKIAFDSLAGNSHKLVENTSTKLSEVAGSLTRIDQSIQKANTSIEEVKVLIRSEMKNSYKQKLKWGTGGFIIGITATALIFALAN